MIHVITKIQRPDPKLIRSFTGMPTATIHEASGRKGYIDCSIKPIHIGIKICGPAFTVQCSPGDNIMLHKALERAEAGDVIVAIVGGAFDYGYFGNLMATSAIAKGLGGLCIEGCIRDSEEIITSGFPIFAKGFCIRGTAKSTLGIINYPIVFGGLTIFPGDLIVGDDDGLVAIRREECSIVLEKTLTRIEVEEEKKGALKTGISSVTYNKFGPIFESAGLEEE